MYKSQSYVKTLNSSYTQLYSRRMEDATTIQITKGLRRELCSIGTKGNTYQQIITNLVKEKKSQTLAEEPEIPTSQELEVI